MNVKIINKYKDKEITEALLNDMRNEFNENGLESLMPLAIKSVFAND